MSSFNRVLIANRGEIAIRIARAAHSLNIDTVAAYSTADAHNLHSRHCHTAVQLPGSDPVGAYLDIDAIIAIALAQQCDCLHPGYGFLAENADLARACAENNITFVGPSAEHLQLFGDKVAARQLAESLNIPTVPGYSERLADADHAASVAAELGYPVMLKALAGGGGRGMRQVSAATELAAAFARCSSEAASSFSNGDLFMEKCVADAKHIEVQVLADSQGDCVHLFERDCSVQQRHQKVVEIAPAPALDPDLRGQLLQAAVQLVSGAGYRNAGTVEFLVDPEHNAFYFIECNPRIQVEHTITEAVTGIDVVAAQFQVAAGMSLADLGLLQDAIQPRGFAIQARIVAQGAGTLTAYKEPSGIGVRVDAHGFTGYAPPPQFDPLLAKLICSGQTYAQAIARTRMALAEFQVTGVATNIGQLDAILQDASVLAGEARTTLLGNSPHLRNPALPLNPVLNHLDQQAKTLGAGLRTQPQLSQATGLTPAEGDVGVVSPMAGAVVQVLLAPGDPVAAGDTLLVISAMKMETAITAPCAGLISQMGDLGEGSAVAVGEVLAAVTPDASGSNTVTLDRQNSWLPTLEELATLQSLAAERLAATSDEPGVVRQRSRGKLHCRERIDLLLDADSFREVGSLAGFASYDVEGGIEAFTPANHVGGWGEIEARTAIVCADDFTSRGGHADGAIGAKSLYLDRLSVELRIPSVRLLDGSSGGGSVAAMVPQQKQAGDSGAKESSGAIKAGRPRVSGSGGSFLPGHLGSTAYTKQLNSVPVVNLLLGSVVGIGAAKAVLGHFSVMVKDIAQLFVAGPPVVSHAMGYDITKEDLGGWHIHCTNGSVDNLAHTEAEAMAMARGFLSYLPPSVYEAPPVVAASDPFDRREEELLTIIPRKRTSTFDIRRVIALIADHDSFFEVGPLWGTDQVTGFIRMNGHPLGVIASDSRHVNGGALTADGCDKLKRHIDLCDTFHVPLLNLVDNPGFAVGVEHEIASTIRKGGEWMVAFAQARIPICTVLLRRSFGVAGNNYATPQSRPAVRVAWPAADVGGIPPEGGIEAAYKRQLAEAEDPVALRAELQARIESARGPVGPLNKFQLEEMIDPRDTRRFVCEWVNTAYRIVNQADHLGPRPLEYRP